MQENRGEGTELPRATARSHGLSLPQTPPRGHLALTRTAGSWHHSQVPLTLYFHRTLPHGLT